MAKVIILALVAVFCVGCHIPHPSNYTGRRTLQRVETSEEVCTVKVRKNGEKVKHCKWVRRR